MISVPPLASKLPVSGQMAAFTKPWGEWFSNAWQILFALSESGTTANRPTKNLWVGRTYYDTTLNRPIWYTASANWIRADGTVV